MSVYYDLYASGNPQKKDARQPLHARVIPSGTLDAKRFIELVSKSNGFSQATIEGCLQAVTDELQHWLKQGWIVEVGELGYRYRRLERTNKYKNATFVAWMQEIDLSA